MPGGGLCRVEAVDAVELRSLAEVPRRPSPVKYSCSMLKPSPRQLKFLLGLFPPYVGSGIRLRHIAPDGSRVVTTHRPRRINANLVGTAFGGTVQTMTDGFYLYMGLVRLGASYNVWDVESHVTFLKPGRGTITADMRTDDATFELIREKTADGSKYLHWFTTDITDVDGDVVATVRSRVYFRLKQRYRTGTSPSRPDSCGQGSG